MNPAIVLYNRTKEEHRTGIAKLMLANELLRWGHPPVSPSDRTQEGLIVLADEREWTVRAPGAALGVVIADKSLLSDRYSYRSANERWKDAAATIKALMIFDPVPHFEYRFINLQFSPMCYVYVVGRYGERCTDLVVYLLNQIYGRK